MSRPQRPAVLPPLNFYMEEGWTEIAKAGGKPRWLKGDKIEIMEATYPSKRLLVRLGYELVSSPIELLGLLGNEKGEKTLLRQFSIKQYYYVRRGLVRLPFNIVYAPDGWREASTVAMWDSYIEDKHKAPVPPGLPTEFFVEASPLDWWTTPASETGLSIKGRPEEFARVIGLTVGFGTAAGKIIRPWSM